MNSGMKLQLCKTGLRTLSFSPALHASSPSVFLSSEFHLPQPSWNPNLPGAGYVLPITSFLPSTGASWVYKRILLAPTSCDSQSLCNLPGRERSHLFVGVSVYFRISANSLTRPPKHVGSLSTPPCTAIAPVSRLWFCWHRHRSFQSLNHVAWGFRGGQEAPTCPPYHKLIRSPVNQISALTDISVKHAVLEAHTSGSANSLQDVEVDKLQILLHSSG